MLSLTKMSNEQVRTTVKKESCLNVVKGKEADDLGDKDKNEQVIFADNDKSNLTDKLNHIAPASLEHKVQEFSKRHLYYPQRTGKNEDPGMSGLEACETLINTVLKNIQT